MKELKRYPTLKKTKKRNKIKKKLLSPIKIKASFKIDKLLNKTY